MDAHLEARSFSPVKYAHSVKLNHVKVANRHRKDMGDIEGLAASIKEHGLLQPIGVTKKSELVFGHRRLEAAKLLALKEIPCVVVDLDSIVTGEYAENEIRKDFTLSERDSIRRAIEAEEREKAKERQVKSGKQYGRGGKVPKNSGEPKSSTSNGSNDQSRHANESKSIAAKRVGLGSHDTASKVGKVVDRGTPELVQAMDKGTISVHAAAKLVELPKPKQKAVAQAAASGKKNVVRKAVKEAEQQAKPEWARGPSPKEAAKNSPGVKWSKIMHDIYMVMNSTRDCGGISALTRNWTDKERADYVAELRQIVGQLDGWITELEL